MAIVSVTRFRARTVLLMPLFMLHAWRAIAQVHRAEGFLAGAVQPDGRLTFWTMSVWRDEVTLMAYVTSGAHRAAMPHLSAWAVEASVVRWIQDGIDLPDWTEVVMRMRTTGRPSPLRNPGPQHAALDFADLQEGKDLRF